jgi:hypothetical protein
MPRLRTLRYLNGTSGSLKNKDSIHINENSQKLKKKMMLIGHQQTTKGASANMDRVLDEM